MVERRRSRSRSKRGDKGGRGNQGGSVEESESALHACGGRKEVAKAVLKLFDDAVETGHLKSSREQCEEFLEELEAADGEREGEDRGAYRLLKAVTVFARLKGYNSRDRMMPLKEVDLGGHMLIANTPPSRAVGGGQKAETVVRALELAVHLVRTNSTCAAVRLDRCGLAPDHGEKCVTEVVRLVRKVGIGRQSRFLEEVSLRENSFDVESIRKIVETAIKERCELPSHQPPPAVPLWLDFSKNNVRDPQKLFKDLVAWAGWAYDRDETGICLAEDEGCTKQECVKKCLLHLPHFFDQSPPERKPPKDGEVPPVPVLTQRDRIRREDKEWRSRAERPLLRSAACEPVLLRPAPGMSRSPARGGPHAISSSRRRRGHSSGGSAGSSAGASPASARRAEADASGASAASARCGAASRSGSRSSYSMEGAEEEPAEGSGSSYTYSASGSCSRSPSRPAGDHRNAQLDQRINRLFESLKSTAANDRAPAVKEERRPRKATRNGRSARRRRG